jgi:23S rRNA (cytosine1962-C5)-methyltransferase
MAPKTEGKGLCASALKAVPKPSERRIALRVTRNAGRSLRRGHPWLFEEAIQHQSHEGQPGDLAVVFDHKRRFLAVGLYDPHSTIRVRLLQHWQPAAIDRAWFEARIAEAASIRSPLLQAPPENTTTGYRLVHGENDGLPGLVVDRYEATLVLKVYTVAWIPHLEDVISGLAGIFPAERTVLRLGRAAQAQPEGLYALEDGQVLLGPDLDGPVLFWENGLRFEADPRLGQKTGFFLDQRDNRSRVEKLVSGLSCEDHGIRGVSVLNLFAYTGGFSVYAARGGARRVVSVDLSRPALVAAERNMALNARCPGVAEASHETVCADAFQVLARMGGEGARYDLVVVDPPSFAVKRSQVDGALAAYRNLTGLALGVLRPGGVLVQASCSSRVPAEEFFDAVHRTAQRAGCPLHEIERTGHALDHPIGFPEGEYLKCLFARVP